MYSRDRSSRILRNAIPSFLSAPSLSLSLSSFMTLLWPVLHVSRVINTNSFVACQRNSAHCLTFKASARRSSSSYDRDVSSRLGHFEVSSPRDPAQTARLQISRQSRRSSVTAVTLPLSDGGLIVNRHRVCQLYSESARLASRRAGSDTLRGTLRASEARQAATTGIARA